MDPKAPIPKWNGPALTALRKAKGWSVVDLAKAVGTNKSVVSKWEQVEGTKNAGAPSVEYLMALIIRFGPVAAAQFFTDIDPYVAFLNRLDSAPSVQVVVEDRETGTKVFTTTAGPRKAPTGEKSPSQKKSQQRSSAGRPSDTKRERHK